MPYKDPAKQLAAMREINRRHRQRQKTLVETQEGNLAEAGRNISSILEESQKNVEELERSYSELERYQTEEITRALSTRPCPDCAVALQLQTQIIDQMEEIGRLKCWLAEKESDLKKVLRLVSYDRVDLRQLKRQEKLVRRDDGKTRS
jgi:flagellar biosynthesis GTPase FlhF